MIFFSENLGDVTRCIISTVVIGYLIQAWFKSRGAVIRVITAMLYNKYYLQYIRYLYFASYLMTLASATAFYRNLSQIVALPDLGFELIQKLTLLHLPFGITISYEKILEIMLPFLLAITVIFVMCRKDNLILLRRIIVIWGTLMYLRTISVLCTSVPDPSKVCKDIDPKLLELSNLTFYQLINKILIVILPISTGSITCGDMIFSGHTTLIVICGMIWHTYFKSSSSSYKNNKYYFTTVKSVIWIIVFFLLYVLIGVRMHYTIDVLLGIYMTITLWNSYHRVGRDVQMGMKFSTMWLIDGFIYPFVKWLEIDDDDISSSLLCKNDSINSFELITTICSLSPDVFKEFISKIDSNTLLRLQKEIKLCKENYLNENYKLAKTEEIVEDNKEKLAKLINEKMILEEDVKDKKFKNDLTVKIYEAKIKRNEEIKKELKEMLKKGNVEESIKLVKQLNQSDDSKVDSKSDNNNELLNKIEILENELKHIKESRNELLLKKSDIEISK